MAFSDTPHLLLDVGGSGAGAAGEGGQSLGAEGARGAQEGLSYAELFERLVLYDPAAGEAGALEGPG